MLLIVNSLIETHVSRVLCGIFFKCANSLQLDFLFHLTIRDSQKFVYYCALLTLEVKQLKHLNLMPFVSNFSLISHKYIHCTMLTWLVTFVQNIFSSLNPQSEYWIHTAFLSSGHAVELCQNLFLYVEFTYIFALEYTEKMLNVSVNKSIQISCLMFSMSFNYAKLTSVFQILITQYEVVESG